MTSQNYEVKAGATVIQRITGNVARNVKINFSGDVRVKSSAGLHPDKVGLAQGNTLASWINCRLTYRQITKIAATATWHRYI